MAMHGLHWPYSFPQDTILAHSSRSFLPSICGLNYYHGHAWKVCLMCLCPHACGLPLCNARAAVSVTPFLLYSPGAVRVWWLGPGQ
jgi:hypothetical protein